ncbi:dipeptide/oligopeptide/nickel ABC transporter permease/ATP-binding protein [Deinococcus radiopugnans]|uniref:Dipeptide/oligopeptide/nickel ABC transporter permease/ATP-binding protein n=1 Tax=Deinococcus radiopugnans ATCC 19172 TaxID=585398 RepID=A0A5C4Y5Z6_9DEIO|nr:dipeptide/oligopeptide/nickel ABC transporter permease/ATP-binding protein [Deinococcus radiopugnans]MBB6015033.1 oligopeptide/dipeptide ABC transporter ATP-binding protein [Deinococcus radiopugnans ATCC 19172]TNM70988.1 dipeptide/oligopeptide/nickel ABC transporter permease/ATP-binding protein [Deinococcus radiopugnans ATCC 19172]
MSGLRRFLSQPRSVFGAGFLLLLLLASLCAPLITPYDPHSLEFDPFLPLSAQHWLGTTALGQDIFAQFIYGARLTLLVGAVAGLIATLLSVTFGLAAAYLGGAVDEAINTLINVFLVLPGLPLVIVASAFLRGGGVWPVILVISFTGWAFGARVLRAQALALRERDFVQAAVVAGEGPGRIIFREMLPNMAGLIAANFFGAALYAVLSEASLSFIGVGDVSLVTWGTMLYWAQAKGALLQGAWWWVAMPGLGIALLGTSFALLNFAIDEISNPRLGGGKFRLPPLRRPAQAGAGGNPDALLSIRELNVGYLTPGPTVRAVRDVSLDVREGELLGLAGESGCGKSTLAFAVTRLLDPPGAVLGGSVRLAEHDLLSLSPEELRRVRWKEFSMVFQASMNVLNPVLKIREQVYDAMQAHGVTDKAKLDARARELFDLVGIQASYLDTYPHQLSGGMKQRVVIAIALALEPKLIVMDEPTTALDVVVQRQILQEINDVRRRLGISIIFITHDLSLLVEMSDRVAIMYAGEVVELAPAHQLYAHPAHPYTQQLMNSFPPMTGPRTRRSGIPGKPPSLSAEIVGCPFFERCATRMPGVCDVKPLQTFPVAEGQTAACFLYDPTVSAALKDNALRDSQRAAADLQGEVSREPSRSVNLN